jgi:hypothetical protein
MGLSPAEEDCVNPFFTRSFTPLLKLNFISPPPSPPPLLPVCPKTSVAEPHNFDAAPAPGENFDAAPAAPAPTLYIASQLSENKQKLT